jgi:hypothetical protein
MSGGTGPRQEPSSSQPQNKLNTPAGARTDNKYNTIKIAIKNTWNMNIFMKRKDNNTNITKFTMV